MSASLSLPSQRKVPKKGKASYFRKKIVTLPLVIFEKKVTRYSNGKVTSSRVTELTRTMLCIYSTYHSYLVTTQTG